MPSPSPIAAGARSAGAPCGYGLAATLASADVLVAGVYHGMPFLGVDQTPLRVWRASGEGWC